MDFQRETAWNVIMAVLTAVAIVLMALWALWRWAWRRDNRVSEQESAEAHKRLLRKLNGRE